MTDQPKNDDALEDDALDSVAGGTGSIPSKPKLRPETIATKTVKSLDRGRLTQINTNQAG